MCSNFERRTNSMSREVTYRKHAKITSYMRGVLDERRRQAFENQEWVQKLLRASVKVVKKEDYTPRHLKGAYAPKHFKAESETTSCQELIHELDMMIDGHRGGQHFEEPSNASKENGIYIINTTWPREQECPIIEQGSDPYADFGKDVATRNRQELESQLTPTEDQAEVMDQVFMEIFNQLK